MPLPPTTLQQLQDMVQQDSALLAQVHGAQDAAAAAALIVQAGARRGIAVDAVALTEHFEQAAAATSGLALSDAQLEAVAGGARVAETIVLSIFTLGIGCAAVSIHTASGRGKQRADAGVCVLD